MTDKMLFETSPIEDEDSKKKKRSSRRRQEQQPQAYSPRAVEESVPGFIASLDIQCERCGYGLTDLAEVRRGEWLIVCGWGCGRQWTIDPIPSVAETLEKDRQFVLREGRFKGKTFSEVWDAGEHWYVLGLAKSGGKTMSSRAAAEWCSKKGIDLSA